jgi:hypothetical protein
LVELGVQDHPGRVQNTPVRVSQPPGLRRGTAGTADHILILAFDPEVRRVIGNVR